MQQQQQQEEEEEEEEGDGRGHGRGFALPTLWTHRERMTHQPLATAPHLATEDGQEVRKPWRDPLHGINQCYVSHPARPKGGTRDDVHLARERVPA